MTTSKKTANESTQSSQDLIAKYGNKSRAIRAMFADGMSRSDISKLLGVRYQHVRNVLITPLTGPRK